MFYICLAVGGAHSVMVIVIGNECSEPNSNLDKAVCI